MSNKSRLEDGRLSKDLANLSVNSTDRVSKKSSTKAEVVESWDDEDDDDDDVDGDDGEEDIESEFEEDQSSPNPSSTHRVSPAATSNKTSNATRPASSSSSVRPETPRRPPSPPDVLYSPNGTPLSGVSAPPNTPRFRDDSRRPEKTVGPAARMIAGALGVRAPRRTEEQRAYEKAAREKERVAREEKRLAEERSVKARASVWDD